MKNVPRIFAGENIKTGDVLPASHEISHYLTHVMRTKECLVFGGGNEFVGELSDDGKSIIVKEKTVHNDVSNDITLYFAPIKRTDDLINMATQMGIAKFQPVITERTVNNHVNWERMKKIAIEAAEQSNRNSVPEILSPIPFAKLNLSNLCFADERFAYFADERFAHNDKNSAVIPSSIKGVLIGPEGGFSDKEFSILDAAGVIPISLGRTILRAEVAAVIAIEKIRK
ncbi:MAG: 16S rRNA (uracil(1498)-N(3))-methyltransferase [Alphaproteobacteria bacterium]|nr:16S rRNA (uracil(1498)-N(3))-methyltransferase [Alphaproteobacteria bacterium]